MNKKRMMKLGILFILGIFVVGVALPVMAGTENGKAVQQKIKGAGNCLRGAFGLGRGNDVIQIVADLTGLEVSDIIDQKKAGKSLVEIFQAKGVSEEALIDKITVQNTANLKTSLDAGKITQTQYDSCIANMPAQIKNMVESTAVGRPIGKGQRMGPGGQNQLKIVAELTGLDINAIMTERKSGKSLAEIAKAKGVEEDVIINKIVDDNTVALKARLDAGKITQAQYDQCISRMPAQVKEMLERTSTGNPNGQGGRGRGIGTGQCQGMGQGTGRGASATSAE